MKAVQLQLQSCLLASRCIVLVCVLCDCRVGFVAVSIVLLSYIGWVRRLHSIVCAGVEASS